MHTRHDDEQEVISPFAEGERVKTVVIEDDVAQSFGAGSIPVYVRPPVELLEHRANEFIVGPIVVLMARRVLQGLRHRWSSTQIRQQKKSSSVQAFGRHHDALLRDDRLVIAVALDHSFRVTTERYIASDVEGLRKRAIGTLLKAKYLFLVRVAERIMSNFLRMLLIINTPVSSIPKVVRWLVKRMEDAECKLGDAGYELE